MHRSTGRAASFCKVISPHDRAHRSLPMRPRPISRARRRQQSVFLSLPHQRAFAFVNVKKADVEWEREPEKFESSKIARRGFCSHCGTPLSFEYNDSQRMDLAVGALDYPEMLKPAHGIESRFHNPGSLEEKKSDGLRSHHQEMDRRPRKRSEKIINPRPLRGCAKAVRSHSRRPGVQQRACRGAF